MGKINTLKEAMKTLNSFEFFDKIQQLKVKSGNREVLIEK